MIKLENTEVFNFEGAIRGMRNPLNSWNKSDSRVITCDEQDNCEVCPGHESSLICGMVEKNSYMVVGDNDLALMRKLAQAGSDHRKFLRQIMVSVDITAPRYWWAEFDTYKVGTVANSCSTMHTIHKRDLTLDDFSTDGLNEKSLYILGDTIQYLNGVRQAYIETEDKSYWRNLIMLLPQNFNQMRTVTLNYEVLLNQYHARKTHKLDEWRAYCDWIESLLYFREICLQSPTHNT